MTVCQLKSIYKYNLRPQKYQLIGIESSWLSLLLLFILAVPNLCLGGVPGGVHEGELLHGLISRGGIHKVQRLPGLGP